MKTGAVGEIEKERFLAQDDSGRVYTVIIHQQVHEHRPLSGPSRTIKGGLRAVLSDGRSLNRLDAETFEIVQTHEVVRKVR